MTVGGHDCCKPAAKTARTESPGTGGRGGLWVAGASVVSAAIASACCWLPLLLVAFGVSAAGVSATFERTRPLFLLAAGLLLAAGFHSLYIRKRSGVPGGAGEAPHPRRRRFNRALLWVATAAVVGFALFPSYAGLLLSSPAPPNTATADSATITLNIDGMSCAACAGPVRAALAKVPGVRRVAVSYADGQARVTVDPTAPPPAGALVDALARAGYRGAAASESR